MAYGHCAIEVLYIIIITKERHVPHVTKEQHVPYYDKLLVSLENDMLLVSGENGLFSQVTGEYVPHVTRKRHVAFTSGERCITHVTAENHVRCVLLKNDASPRYSITTWTLCFTGERYITHVTTERHIPCV